MRPSGVVDAADYVVWRNTLGQSGTGLAADGNGNGIVDSLDDDVWKRNCGQALSGSAATIAGFATVPEPTERILLLMSCAGLFSRRDRKRNGSASG